MAAGRGGGGQQTNQKLKGGDTEVGTWPVNSDNRVVGDVLCDLRRSNRAATCMQPPNRQPRISYEIEHLEASPFTDGKDVFWAAPKA